MPLTVTLLDVNALRSAIPPGTANELISTSRKRKRVIGPPVLFTKRRLTESVPFVALGGTAVKSRTRFGDDGAPIFESSNSVDIVVLRTIGLPRFCGPGAPSR